MNNESSIFRENNMLECLKVDEYEKMNTIGRVPLLLTNIGLFIINIILCFCNTKKNKELIVCSIAGAILSFIGNYLYSFGQLIDGINKENVLSIILQLLSFVIQMIIFVIVVINIIKNKKKEENPKCQE